MDNSKLLKLWKKGWGVMFFVFVLVISIAPIVFFLRIVFDSATFYPEIIFFFYLLIIGPIQYYYIFTNFFGKAYFEKIALQADIKDKCTSCGEDLGENKDYCPHCGWTYKL
jgi:hypothetical protein